MNVLEEVEKQQGHHPETATAVSCSAFGVEEKDHIFLWCHRSTFAANAIVGTATAAMEKQPGSPRKLTLCLLVAAVAETTA